MKRTNLLTLLLWVFIGLTVLFIFSRSLANTEKSQEESDAVKEVVEPILSPVVGEENVSDKLIRKLAHFTEFSWLGAELSVLLWWWRSRRPQTYLNITFFAVLIALCDETIQIFTDRGPQIQDVWIDIAGAVFGFAIVLSIRGVVCWITRRHLLASTGKN